MPHKKRSWIDRQQELSDHRRLAPDLETSLQTFCLIRASNADTQLQMIFKSHDNKSIVKPDRKAEFDMVLGRILEDLIYLKILIRASIKES